MSRRACIGGRSRRRWLCDSVALCCSQVWLVIYPAKQEYRIYSVALPIFNTENENTFQPTRSFLRWRRMPWPNSFSWLPWIFSFWYGKWGGPTKKTTFCKNSVAVEIFLERPQDWSFYRTRVRSLAMLVSDSLTDWLTHSCLVSLIDVTLACEDLNSKLGEVVTFADVDTEDQLVTDLGADVLS